MSEDQQINAECQDCPIVKTYCRQLWRDARKSKERKPVFIAGIVALAVKHGSDMRCLRGLR